MKTIKTTLLFIVSAYYAFCQDTTKNLTKTVEYKDDIKRRELFFTNEMKLVKENYFNKGTNKIINTITYTEKGEIIKVIGYSDYPKEHFVVDFENGLYIYPEKKLKLRFVGNFEFDGIQEGKNIIVNYSKGKRNGKLIQTDSGAVGNKIVSYEKVDPRYLQFNIIKFYNEISSESTYKLFKGLNLNFVDDKLNGKQFVYYVNGKTKIESHFIDDRIVSYNSFDIEGNTISKIDSQDELVSQPYILNGTFVRSKDTVTLKNEILSLTGTIYELDRYSWGKSSEGFSRFSEDNYNEIHEFLRENQKKDEEFPSMYDLFINRNNKKALEVKESFDKEKILLENNPELLFLILLIPQFDIQRYNFDKFDQSDVKQSIIDTLSPAGDWKFAVGHLDSECCSINYSLEIFYDDRQQRAILTNTENYSTLFSDKFLWDSTNGKLSIEFDDYGHFVIEAYLKKDELTGFILPEPFLVGDNRTGIHFNARRIER